MNAGAYAPEERDEAVFGAQAPNRPTDRMTPHPVTGGRLKNH